MGSNLVLEDYRNSWALVTGASSGIGAEFCRQLSRHHVNLVMVARRVDRMNSLVAEIGSYSNIRTLVLPLDLSLSGSAEKLIGLVEVKGIKIRILINNAAYGPWGHFARVSPEDQERLVQLLFGTPTTLIRGLLNHLNSFPSSTIINLSSQAAIQPIPYLATYSACKAGLHNLSLALHEELRLQGIYVQTLVPGPTSTEIDQVGGAYECGLSDKRNPPKEVVTLSLHGVATKRPIVSSVKNLVLAGLFNALFPTSFVLRKIGRTFQPPTSTTHH
jgi:short-subunit dehydrogenase